MILRAKTKNLFQGKPLTEKQQKNTDLNLKELENSKTVLESKPRRLVFELTNVCNLNCIMCGRNAVEFKPTVFQLEWLQWFEPMLDTVEEVTLMGWGEPTIHPQFKEMLQIIDKYAARKYFCTNGMNLNNIIDAIFDYKVDVFAVSVDGATSETNNRIRRGSDLQQITDSLENIVRIRNERGLKYPYINFVFCAMKSNLKELPELVRLAAKIGIEEVKVVYLTVFEEALLEESLWDCTEEVKEVFDEAVALGDELGIVLKLPHLQGEDVAEDRFHKDCFVPWRDFFLGSDGFIRPCMSTPRQFMKFDMNKNFGELWNEKIYQEYRANVNDAEKMEVFCKQCYQSSHCNWNKKTSFLKVNEDFAPQWEK